MSDEPIRPEVIELLLARVPVPPNVPVLGLPVAVDDGDGCARALTVAEQELLLSATRDELTFVSAIYIAKCERVGRLAADHSRFTALLDEAGMAKGEAVEDVLGRMNGDARAEAEFLFASLPAWSMQAVTP